MSSDWQPPRTPRFGIALIPPRPRPAETGERREPPEEAFPGPAIPAVSSCGESIAVSTSCGWTAVAASASAPVSIAVVASHSADLWPERWLHPNERLRMAGLAPSARRESMAAITAARRALAAAWHLPAPALACFDFSPLLDGLQSLRVGDWTVQRVPAPSGIHVTAAAPGAGWSYSLLPLHAVPGSVRA